VERLLRDDVYCAQEKHNGRHILIHKQEAQIHGINKKGLLVGFPRSRWGNGLFYTSAQCAGATRWN